VPFNEEEEDEREVADDTGDVAKVEDVPFTVEEEAVEFEEGGWFVIEDVAINEESDTVEGREPSPAE